MDCLALELGCQALSEHPDLRLSINISPRTIGHPRWEQVFDHAAASDCSPWQKAWKPRRRHNI